MNVREWKHENAFIVNRLEGEIVSAISCQFFSWNSLFSQALASREQEIWKQLHSSCSWIQALLSSNMLWPFQKAHPKYEVFVCRPEYCKFLFHFAVHTFVKKILNFKVTGHYIHNGFKLSREDLSVTLRQLVRSELVHKWDVLRSCSGNRSVLLLDAFESAIKGQKKASLAQQS